MARKKSKKIASFETSLETLRQIVSDLETGNLTLGDSLEKYEQGIVQLKQCQETLAAVQQKIELLVELDDDGNLVTRPFDHSQTGSGNSSVRRKQEIDVGAAEDDIEDVDDRLDEEFSDGLF